MRAEDNIDTSKLIDKSSSDSAKDALYTSSNDIVPFAGATFTSTTNLIPYWVFSHFMVVGLVLRYMTTRSSV